MGLEDQAAVKRVADEHGSGVVVLLGTPDAESTQTLAQTVVAGDPSYAGPLAGVPLGLPVFHVFEPEVRDQVPADVYEAQVALMEMSLDREAILAGLREARRAGAKTWKAYLSTQGPGAVNAHDRIGSGPWKNAKGIIVAKDLAELHGNNNINKQTALTEKGETVNGRGDTPNMHDILTGSQPDGTA